MKSRRCATVVALLVAAVTVVTPSGANQATPVGTLRAEVRSLQAGALASYYALLSPAFHKKCSFATFRPDGRKEEQALRGASLRILGDRIVGTKAYLTYEFLRGGVVLGKATDDLYVKIGASWFDEIDRYTTC
jgi:hypothetical protein